MIYSKVLKTVVLPVADKAMGTSISYYLGTLKDMRNYSKDDITRWQNKKLRNLIDHAYTNTTYYKSLLDDYGINPSEIKSIDDLKKIPKLTKEDIRKNFKNLTPSNIDSISYKKASTGGSTGEPLSYYLDLNSWSFVNASNIINWEKAGYKYGEKYVSLGSTSLFVDDNVPLKHRFYYALKNKIGLNGVNMSVDTCREYVELIKKRKIKYLYGYASSIYLLAKFVSEQKAQVPLKACFTTSEGLTEHFRNTIQHAFNCKIIDCYGARDGGISAYSHTKGSFEVTYNSLLIHKDNKIGELSPVYVTDLLNYSTPLINYDLGDMVSIKKSREHNYNGQLLDKVGGRASEIIELENGNAITGPGFTILFKDLPVEYYQIRKTGKNSILCRIKSLPGFTDNHMNTIEETLKKNLGDEVNFEITFTDKFEYTKSGKLKYFIN